MSKIEQLQRLVEKYEVYVRMAERSINKKEAKIVVLKSQGHTELAREKENTVNYERAELEQYRAKVDQFTRAQLSYA